MEKGNEVGYIKAKAERSVGGKWAGDSCQRVGTHFFPFLHPWDEI